jgi:hypothetical protein
MLHFVQHDKRLVNFCRRVLVGTTAIRLSSAMDSRNLWYTWRERWVNNEELADRYVKC